VGAFGFAVISFVPGKLLGLGQDHAVKYIARSDQDLHNQLGLRVLHYVTFVAIKPLLRGLAAETGIWVWRVAVHLVVVVIGVPVLLFQAKQVHFGAQMGASMMRSRYETKPWARPAPPPGEQTMEALGSQALPELAENSCDRGGNSPAFRPRKHLESMFQCTFSQCPGPRGRRPARTPS
jgi:hypothetical protein